MTLDYDFQLLTDKLLSLGAICSAAELQGMYCGLIAGGRDWQEEQWLEHALEFTDLSHFETTPAQRSLLLFVLEQSRQSLSSDDFSFQPLLPDDACPAADRARELGAWCKGFLHGFGASGVTKETELSPDVAEVIRDIAKICTAVSAVEQEDDDEDDTDADLFELIEYVRAGVLTIYGEMNVPADKPKDESGSNEDPTVH